MGRWEKGEHEPQTEFSGWGRGVQIYCERWDLKINWGMEMMLRFQSFRRKVRVRGGEFGERFGFFFHLGNWEEEDEFRLR